LGTHGEDYGGVTTGPGVLPINRIAGVVHRDAATI